MCLEVMQLQSYLEFQNTQKNDSEALYFGIKAIILRNYLGGPSRYFQDHLAVGAYGVARRSTAQPSDPQNPLLS